MCSEALVEFVFNKAACVNHVRSDICSGAVRQPAANVAGSRRKGSIRSVRICL